jgi:uncharacterized protein
VDPLVVALAIAAMLVGLVGVVVPVMPGLLVVWGVAVGTTLWVAADVTGWLIVVVLTVLFALGTAATLYLPARQGRRGGAPVGSLVAAALGAVVGFVVIPVAGFLLGAFGGYLLAEHRRLGEWGPAWSSLGTVMRAYGVGVVVELTLGLTMIAVWAAAAVLR